MPSERSRRVFWLFNGFQFFFSLLPWVPIFYEYQKRIGLSDTQIFSIQSVYYLAFCLFEIPTGLIADRWGQLRCIRLGALILVASSALPIFFPTSKGFLLHFVLIALSRSLISGASSAYLYEYLNFEGALSLYKSAEGNARAYSLLGKVVCWASVGALMQWKLSIPYWMSLAAAMLSVAFAWALPARRRSPALTEAVSSSRERNVLHELHAIYRHLAETPVLAYIMIQGVAVFVLTRLCQINLFQPILGAKGFGVASYGLVLSGLSLFEALGSAKPQWISERLTDLTSVFILTGVMAACMALLGWEGSGQYLTLFGLAVFSLATGFCYPIQRHLLNQVIPDSAYRATFLSLESIVDRAACAIVALEMGRFLGQGQLNQFLWLSAGGAIFMIVALLTVKKNFINPLKHFDKVVGVH